MSAEQTEMVRALTSDGAAVAVVLGRAGAGKTFALSAAHEAWARSKFPVLGAAVARHAAQQLESETAIPSVSLAQLVAGLERGERLPRRIVLVVDEAGMAGTRQLATLLDHVEAARGKLVLVGDDRQLAAIDAGGAFGALARRGLAVELTENRRQRHAWEREAVEHLRAGRGEEAIAAYQAHDRLVVEPDEDRGARAARRRLVGGRRPVDVGDDRAASRRRRRPQRSGAARMRDAGALGAEELELRAGGFSVGDHVLIRQNHLGLGISNGQRGIVTSVDVAERRLELEIDGRRVRLGSDFLDASTRQGDPTLTHGYAITGHAAQGTTVDRAFVLADPSLSQEWGYTALTRGRESNHLYLAADRALWRDEFAPHDPAPPDPIAQLARALSKSNAQTLAIDASPLSAAEQELRRLESSHQAAARDESDGPRRRRQDLERRASRWRPSHATSSRPPAEPRRQRSSAPPSSRHEREPKPSASTPSAAIGSSARPARSSDDSNVRNKPANWVEGDERDGRPTAARTHPRRPDETARSR